MGLLFRYCSLSLSLFFFFHYDPIIVVDLVVGGGCVWFGGFVLGLR
jgi:hypothetical protein